VFVRPHEIQDLRSRLEEKYQSSSGNQQDGNHDLITRLLRRAEEELMFGKAAQEAGTFSRIVVNAVIESALAELKEACVQWYVVYVNVLLYVTNMRNLYLQLMYIIYILI
jgi:guanylate kinase